jgi:hypothetical protein
MRIVVSFGLLVALAVVPLARAIYEVELAPKNRIAPDAAGWRELAEAFARQPDIATDFTERRFFPFRTEPVVLKGEVRVSRSLGLSLHYTAPEDRVVILDQAGVVIREASGQKSPPDPRAAMANAALLHILQFDFAALEKDFELYGRREGGEWSIGLVPRAEPMRRAIGNIYVGGEGNAVRKIELRRSVKQHIDIEISAPRASGPFSAEDVKRYFR